MEDFAVEMVAHKWVKLINFKLFLKTANSMIKKYFLLSFFFLISY